jgi:hypothetical protein
MAVGTVNYPGSLDTSDTLIRAANGAQSTLSGTFSSGATTASLVSAANFPSSGTFTCENEIIYYSGKSSNDLTGCSRGQEGTADVAQSSGVAVQARITARHHNVLADAIIATQTEIDSDVAKKDTANTFTQNQAVGSGDNVSLNDTTGAIGQIHSYRGTSASPITTGAASNIKASLTIGMSRATYEALPGVSVGGQNSDQVVPIVGYSEGTADMEVQAVGVFGGAKNAGDTNPSAGAPDACGIFGHGWISEVGSIGRAIGGYFAGRSELASTPKITGVEVQCQSRGAADDTYDSSGTSNTVGVLMSNASTGDAKRGCGIQFNHGTSCGKYDVGIGFSSNDGGPCVTATIVDGGSAATSIQINGTHSTAAIALGSTAGPIDMNANYLQMAERTAPSAPAANGVRLYAVDNGAGKTQLMALFSSGAAQQVAIQP